MNWKEKLLNNFKDPYFVITLWRYICILAFVVGIILGAKLVENYYIEQVNNIFQAAVKQDGCFGNFLNNQMKYNPSRFVENLGSMDPYNITYIAPKTD